MKTRTVAAQLSAALLLTAASDAALAYTGSDLLGFCKASTPMEKGLCTGLINGTVNSYVMASRISGFRLMASIARNACKSA